MKNLVTCGTLKGGLGYSDIVCDPSTGDLIFCDDLNGNCVMSNLSVTDPLDVSENVLHNIMKETNSDGVIMSATYIITIKDNTAEYRKVDCPSVIEHNVTFDTDVVYDEPVER